MAQIPELEAKFCVAWTAKMSLSTEEVRSPPFSYHNIQWYLRLKISSTDPTFRLSLLSIPLKARNKPFRATVLLDDNDGGIKPCNGCIGKVIRTSQVLWKFCEDDVRKLFPAYEFEDDLKFVCIFESDPPVQYGTVSPDSSNHLPYLESLSLDLSKLLKDEVFSDVKLKCGDQTIYAHRNVLAARSEVFAAMFRNKMMESETGVVDVPDVEAKVLDLFLKFVYTGEIQDLPEDLVPCLYAAGDKYEVHGIKKTCSDRMVAGLTKDNCINTLLFADGHSDSAFKEAVVSFICSHEAIFRSEAWLGFYKKNLKLASEVYQSYFMSKT